ncbi:MAG TPA: sigma-70 family RNA polymerase sigma factor [Jatrophihabitans sp.]|jgi:RNA polymerase sigma-70 factor (ECF subfamily)
MDENALADRFEAQRGRLRAVAFRILASPSEAEDAVQEAWLRLSRTDADTIDNLDGWLTTVVARICLNMLQSRKTRREASLDEVAEQADEIDPEQEAVLAESVGTALLVVLDTLSPAERLAFVLHDLFVMPFDEIAPIVGRAPAAARQLASRARRRVAGAAVDAGSDTTRQREVVGAFLAASRRGDFAALVALLDPDAVARSDDATVRSGAPAQVHGADSVAAMFAGRARAARPALVDGRPGLAWLVEGAPRVVFDFTILDGTVVAIDLIADPTVLAELDLTLI